MSGVSHKAAWIYLACSATSILLVIAGAFFARSPGVISNPKDEPAKLIGTGQNDMRISTYRSLAPREPKVLTVFCKLSDSYNYEFATWDDPGNRDRWLSISLVGRDRDGAITGFAPKNTPLANRLIETLGNGGRWLTVEVERKGQSSSYVRLNRIVE